MPRALSTEIRLNVYDLIDNTNYYGYGLGIYHSGLQISATEYTFGREGTFTHEPTKAPMVPLRDSVFLASIELPHDRIMSIVDEVSREFNRLRYHLLERNCNHYAKAVYEKILDRCGQKAKDASTPIPGYVNRMAWLGSKFKCLIPPEIVNTAVPSSATGTEAAGEEKNTARFTAFQGSGRSLSGNTEKDSNKNSGGFLSSFLGGSGKEEKNSDGETEMYYSETQVPDQKRRETLLKAAEKRLAASKPSTE